MAELVRRLGSPGWRRVAAGAAVAVIVLALYADGALSSLDLSSIDARFSLRGTERPTGVVFVGEDNTTFNYFINRGMRAPFPRRYDAAVITNLAKAGARVVAVDLVFETKTDTADDDDLILATRAAGNVVLATTSVLPGGRTPIFGGGSGLALSRGVVGFAQFTPDSDGAIRQMKDQILGVPTFAIAAVQRARGRPVAFPGGPDASAPIDFAGPAGTVTELSFSNVMNDDFPAAAVRGKIVVVGVDDPLIGDQHATATSPVMAGSEVQADAIQTALDGFPLSFAPGVLNVLLIISFAVFSPLIGLRLRVLPTLAATAGAVAVLLIAAQLAFDGGLIIGFVYPVLAAILSAGAAFALQARRAQVLEARLPAAVSDFFVSYRRSGSEFAANMVKQSLVRRLGERRVFMDVDGLSPGEQWPERLERAAKSSRAMLVMIGPTWLDQRAPDGSRRLDDPDDWVRRELETALSNPEATVVPILHDGARMPTRQELPPTLAPLADCQARVLSGTNIDDWVRDLIDSVNRGRVHAASALSGPLTPSNTPT